MNILGFKRLCQNCATLGGLFVFVLVELFSLTLYAFDDRKISSFVEAQLVRNHGIRVDW